MRKYISITVICLLQILCCNTHLQAQKCINLGVGIGLDNGEYALIDYFKNNQHWEVADETGKEWYACADMNEFKVVNGAYYNYDRDWSCDVNNDAWGEPWDDTYISYWDMMVDQGRIRPDGYPVQIPTTVYRYHTKSEDPQQNVNTSQVVNITRFTRRMYFPQGLPHSGWVLKWEGTGTIRFQGLENVVADAGTTAQQNGGSWYPAGYTFSGNDYTFTSTGTGRVETDLYWMIHGWVLEIVDSDPNDPIRNVVMLFPGLEAAYDAGQRFNPQYIERMSQFNSLRYMGYLNSNGIQSRPVMAECHPFRYTDMLSWLRWDERTPENWYCLNNGNGGSYEYIVELSNLTKTDPWVNIPYCADEKYTDSLVRFFMERLDPDLTLYLEVGNELWNFAPEFDGYFWQAALRVIEYPGLGDFEAHGAHINKIFERVGQVAGTQNLPRIVRVYAGWPRYTDVNNRTLNYIDRDNWDALATTWYFNLPQSEDGDGCTDPATGTNWRSTLYNWWEANPNDQTGFNNLYRDCLLNQFRCTGGYANNSDVVLANYYGKYVVCYEGGNHTMYGCTNGPTGGALTGELDFDTPTYPDYITDNGFVNAIAIADESEQMAEVYEEVIDSLQSAGVRLANHLSFAGSSSCYGVWSFIQPRDLLDPLPDLLAKYPKFRVFSDRIKTSNCTQLEIVLEADSVGAGLSVMLDGFNDYIQPNLSNLPDETGNYSFETWFKATTLDREQSIFTLSNSGGAIGYNLLRIREDNKLVWEIINNGVSVMKLVGPVIQAGNWNQVAVTKNGNRFTLYLNGTIVASANATLVGLPKDTFTIGASLAGNGGLYFCGEIDEFRFWSVARTQEEIRDFMCKRVPDSYAAFANLRAYYRFDSPDYITAGAYDRVTKTSTATLHNINITARSRYAVSGAALGDESVNLYPSSWNNISLSLRHPNGDMIAVRNLGAGSPDGVHLYLINNTTYYHDVPEYYIGIDTTRTYGVFTTNGTNANYDILYVYQGNPKALAGTNENDNRLIRRDNYASQFWRHAGAVQNLQSNSLAVNCRETYRGEYALAFREEMNQQLPGSGMALLNSQVPSGNIDGKILYLELHDYTVSFWARGIGEVFNFTGKYGENEQKFTLNAAWEQGVGCEIRSSYSWGNTQYITPGSRVARVDEWKNYTITRKGQKVTIYINGIESASGNILDSYTINEMHLFNDPQWQTGNYPDGHCNLAIDELQVWDMALDQATIRDWMCKKINENHPFQCEHLVLYFNFDEGTGSVLEDKRGSSDIVLTTDGSGFQWIRSGAAIGDESVHDYLSPENIMMTHPNGDVLEAVRTSGTSTGIHLYRVDNMPPVPTTTDNVSIVNMDSTRYWGMYVVDNYGSVNQQNIIYNYETNSQINLAEEANIRLLSRYDNAASPWSSNIAVLPDNTANTIQLTNQVRGEYIIGAISSTAINDFLAPENPVFQTESAEINRTSFCGNETNLTFAVIPDTSATNYIWILPAYLNGFSNTNVILLNCTYSGSTVINTTIGIAATNNYGSSDTVYYAVQIVPAPTIADAGPDIILLPPDNSAIMDGNNPLPTETGSWTFLGGNVSFTDNESPNTVVNNIAVGENILQWSISNGVCPASLDSMILNYAPSPENITMAGGNSLRLTYCEGEQITLKAIPQEDILPASYVWTLPNGMQMISQSGDEATLLVGDGFGGTISVAAVYNGISSPAYVSSAIGISPVPEKPVFADTPSVLCLNVDQLLSIQYSSDIDSVVWTMPFGIYPTDFPKSTTESIEIQGILQVSGYIKAQAYYNSCTSANSSDSIFVEVRTAPAKPMLYLGTDGGTADEICNNDNAILWVRNYDPAVQYEWQWATTVSHIQYFGDNRSGAEFTFGNENSNVFVRSVTNDIGCNTSEWFEFYGWVWNRDPSTITNVQITNPAAQDALNLTVGQTYTVSVTGTGNDYYWNLPEGLELVDDGDIYNEVNQIRVVSASAGTLEVYPITLLGCAGDAFNLNLAVQGALFPPEYVSGNPTICQSTNLNITVTDVGATEYVWTLPDSTIFTTSTPVLNEIVSTPQSGIMTVIARTATAVSTALELDIQVNAVVLQRTGFVDQDNNPLTSIEVCTNDANKPIYHRWSNTSDYIWNIEGSAIQFEPRYEPGHNNDNNYELNNRTSPTDTMMPISWVSWRCRNDGSDGGYIYVTAVNGCGGADITDSIYYYWAIPMNQQVPEYTTAPTSACVGSSVNFEIKEIPFAQQYIWHVPGGLVVDDIVTTVPSLTASVVNGSGGILEVYAVSDVCGLSKTTTLYSDPISIQGEPVDFEFIDAPTAVCPGDELTFTVNDIGAGIYTWILPEGLSSVTVDNDDAGAVVSGNWNEENVPNMINGSALTATHYSTANSVVFTPDIPSAGLYKVWISYFTQWDTRADVPVTVTHSAGVNNVFVNMQVRPEDNIWHELGDFYFNTGTTGTVRIATNGSGGGISVADAVKFEPVGIQGDTTITVPVRSTAGGAVCVEAIVSSCSSPYRICTDPINLTGELADPIFVTQETSVCEGMEYLYRISDIGAEAYEWILPAGMNINGATGNVLTGNRQVTVTMETNTGSPVQIAARGLITSCNITSETVYTLDINFDGAGCKLATPVYILPEDTIYEPEIVRFYITEVQFAEEYVWVLPAGVQQAGGSGGEITTTVNYIDLEVDGTLYGASGVLKVVAKATGIEQSDTAFTPLPLILIQNLPAVADFSTNVNSICAGAPVVITNESTNANGLTCNWNFGTDAVPAGSSLSTPPNVRYSTGGTKTITLELRDNSNVVVSSHILDIEVLASPSIASVIVPQTCEGENSQITINLAGTAPYELVYTLNGGTPVSQSVTTNSYTLQIASDDVVMIQSLSDNSCSATISQNIVADVYPAFTVTISGDASIYEGESTNLQVVFTGTAPWNITLSDGQTFDNIATSPFLIPVTEAGTYSITNVSDANCTGQTAGSATISYIGFDYAVISGTDTICPGENATLSLTLEGIAPWNVTIEGTGGQETLTGITTSPYVFTTALSDTITLVSATDSENKTLERNGFGVVVVRDVASLVSVSDQAICPDDLASISVVVSGGVSPWTVEISDGQDTTTYQLASLSNQIDGFDTGDYTVVSIADNYCTSSTNMNFSITALPVPTAVISGDAVIVQGESATLEVSFTGTAPFSVELNDGSVYSDIQTNTFSIQKTEANIYTITSVSDAVCSGTATGSATVEYSDVPSATLSGGGAVCDGSALPQISVTLTGNEPWMLVYERDGVNDTLRDITQNTITIPAVANDTITLVSVFDVNNISGIVDGSAYVTVYEQSAFIVPANVQICNGETSDLEIQFTGAAPWTVNVNGIEYANLNASLLLSDLNAGDYVISDFSDAHCTYSQEVTYSIAAYPLATATISGSTNFCNPNDASLDITFTGTAPWTASVRASDQILNFTDIQTNVFSFPLSLGIYSLISASDAYCAAEADTNTIVYVNQVLSPNIDDLNALYGDDPVIINQDGDTVRWYDDPSLQQFIIEHYSFNPGVTEIGVYTYFVTRTDGNCESEADSVILTVNPNTHIFGSDQTCSGVEVQYFTANNPQISYIWSVTGGTIVSGTGTNAVRVIWDETATPKSITLTEQLISNNTVQNTYQLPVTITTPPEILVETLIDNCDRSATIDITNGTATSRYDWTTSNGTVTVSQDRQSAGISFMQSGTHTINISETYSVGCSGASTSVSVTIPESSDIQFTVPSQGYVGIAVPIYYEAPAESDFQYTGNITNVADFERITDTILLTAQNAGSYNLIIGYTDPLNGCTYYTGTERITILSIPELSISGETNICTERSYQYSISAASAYSVDWITPQNTSTFTDNGKSIEVSFSEGGTQTLEANVYNLSVTSRIVLHVSLPVNIEETPAPEITGSQNFCSSGDFVSYAISETDGYTYKWETDIPYVIARTVDSSMLRVRIANGGTYYASVIETNRGGCSGYDTLIITVRNSPKLGGNATIEHCFDEEPQFMVTPDSGFTEYKIDQTIQTNPQVLFTEPGYLAYSVTENGCESFDTVFVTDGCKSLFAVPEAFSPNGDGLNDSLRVFGHHFEITEFIVVNKWGEQVFRATDNNLRWDGTYHDSPAPDGTYTWQAYYTDSEGHKRSVNGKVVLTR